MLKRLELVGFKSFADKTAFDFAPGVTAVVGPNGSGKSNVVDAVRWVLGEQSAKSLRGGEMADVIFNGSGSRRSLGLAEVTLTFDNSRGVLSTAATEVQVSRRVYRDGQGEYLINGQPSRLKDVKDLFLGSGAGTSASCIIQQGQVDALLQASAVDRRAIFEEAAGISRFKVKRAESLRRLERVDQNLQRLKDIIAEVDAQLRSVRLQAAKAQRHQEYTQRLQELRVALGLREYRELTEQLDAVQAVLDRLRAELAAASAKSAGWADDLRRVEGELTRIDAAGRAAEGQIAEARTRIAEYMAAVNHEQSLTADLEADLARTRSAQAERDQQVLTLDSALAAAEADRAAAERQGEEQRQQVWTLADGLKTLMTALADLHRQIQADKVEHLERMRQAARLQNDAVSVRAQLEQLRRERERLSQKSSQAEEHLASLDLDLEGLTGADADAQGRLGAAKRALADRTGQRDSTRALVEALRHELAELRAKESGLLSRIEVLEGLERSQEGLGTGIREVLTLLGSEAHGLQPVGLGGAVIGLVADHLTVPREFAPLIDLALGATAQCFLVRDPERLALALSERPQAFSGRVGFLPVRPGPAAVLPPVPWPGIARRADALVHCDHPELAGLATQLLGTTLLVPDLLAARELAAQTLGYRFVTMRGELLEADGTLTVGTHHAETGIISRKSELRELRQQAGQLADRIARSERELAAMRERAAALEGEVSGLLEEVGVLAELASDLRARIEQHRQKRAGLQEQMSASRSEITGLDGEIDQLDAAWQQAGRQAAEAEQAALALHQRLEQAERSLRAQEQERLQGQQAQTAAQVALAQVEERLAGHATRCAQLAGDRDQRRRERDDLNRHARETEARLEESARAQVRATDALADCHGRLEQSEQALTGLASERERLRLEQRGLHEQVQQAHGTWQAHREEAHARELEASDRRHRCDALVQRLRDDYGIDLQAKYRELADEAHPLQRVGLEDAAREEIEELKRKLSRLGSVNLDALQELAESEQRAGALQVQFDDLTAAQKSLQEIIAKINGDSRRLFAETFASVRGHFQELFRKLFGGGMADVTLEDENDPLESGIEVTARPPGKELRSIALMSGGEKTLTAVALLLAIFRSKPAPFCLLDEVDAALDEANTARLTGVVREFQDRSQFIIVTHSKRTMAAADVLYGITMQESGISKRVAVRFEDWPDDEKRAA